MTLRFKKARARIFTIILLMLIVMWGLVISWSISERKRVISANDEILAQLRSALAEQTKGLFRAVELSLFASERWISSHKDEDPTISPEFIRIVDEFRRLTDNIADIRIVSKSGGLQYVPRLSSSNLADVSDRDYFTAQSDTSKKGFMLGQPVKGRFSEKWIIPVSMPISTPSEHAAVIFAAIDLERITGLHELSRIKQNGTVTILSDKGVIVARAPFDERMIGGSIMAYPEFSNLIQKDSGFFFNSGQTTDGIPRKVCFARLKDYPLLIAVSSGVDEVLLPWKKQASSLVFFSFFVTIFVFFLWHRLLEAIRQREEAHAKLEFQAKTDALTGLPNRRSFLEALGAELERATRYSRPLSVLMIDVDFFKKINDNYGHATGDEVLKALGSFLSGTIRTTDIAGRIGGEEFCVFLPEADANAAMDAAERLRSGFENVRTESGNQTVAATLSIGVSEISPSDDGAESIMDKADKALYKAKSSGRNRVCLYEPE